MPLIVVCKRCGYILYNGEIMNSRRGGITMPTDPRKVASKHKWRCPNCGRELELPDRYDVEVTAAESR